MEERYYVLSITVTSSGAEDRKLTPYGDKNTAIRKYHEAFNGIGGGPTFISAEVLDKYLNVVGNYRDYWELEETPEE